MLPNLSILVISRSQKNILNLLASIPTAVDQISYEIMISWNGKAKPDVTEYVNKGITVRVYDIHPYHFSQNNNQISNLAKGELLLFINDDVVLDPGVITKGVRLIKRRDIGIVGANLRYPSRKIQHAGIFIDDELKPYHLYKGNCHFRDPRVSYERDVPAVTGAFLLIRKEEFLSLQFDERCRVAAQDVILCFQYRARFSRRVVYAANVTGVHHENETRKLFDQRTTPREDIALMKESIEPHFRKVYATSSENIKLRIITENRGWIMYRMAEEIAKRLKHTIINQDYRDANVHYYINYGHYRARPPSGVVVANFTHFDHDLHRDGWIRAAKEVDHCVAISEEAAENIRRFGISQEKITVIKVGADVSFYPRMTIGIVGRVYPGGRKGESLVRALLEDSEIMNGLQIISSNEGWGVPVWHLNDLSDFYRAIDYLLVPSLIEGGPVPFMEALACGTLAIAPPIGVIPEFPHIEYKTGDIESLKNVVKMCKEHYLERKRLISNHMANYNWSTWALQHINLFSKLLNSINVIVPKSDVDTVMGW